MRAGLALPHYDFSVPGRVPLDFPTIVARAERAEALGFDTLWVSDHLTLSVEKYGGPPGEHFAYEPLTLLAALARRVPRVRLGTLVLCEALRPATVAAKALATLDRLCHGRLDIGMGAGWYGPDYAAIGVDPPSPATRLRHLEEALVVLDGLLGGGPVTAQGESHRARSARNHPPAVQMPRPPLFVGGRGDRLLRLAARRADGWNTCWVWTPEAYRERLAVFERACRTEGRDPNNLQRTLGLYALAGEDHADLEARYARLVAGAPGGLLDGVSLEEWRIGRLVGTVEEVAEQAAGWAELGISELIGCVGPVPFSLPEADDLDVLAAALGRAGASL